MAAQCYRHSCPVGVRGLGSTAQFLVLHLSKEPKGNCATCRMHTPSYHGHKLCPIVPVNEGEYHSNHFAKQFAYTQRIRIADSTYGCGVPLSTVDGAVHYSLHMSVSSISVAADRLGILQSADSPSCEVHPLRSSLHISNTDV